MKKIFVFSAILVFRILSLGHARIINIPADYSTIQSGINSSINGDTVLVQPGTYHENINFYGHDALLCSKFLTNGDTSAIDSTVIDGDSANSVIIFLYNNNSAAVIGFTIKNGRAVYGGGIRCVYSYPGIIWNIIRNNYATAWDGGGGIFCDSSDAIITFNKIYGNNADWNGGGISCKRSNPLISHNVIYRNRAYY
jgi:hypothetical protein